MKNVKQIMHGAIVKSAERWLHRLTVLVDGNAWVLILPFIVLWMQIDPADIKATVLWLTKLPIIVGFVVMLCRLILPQIDLRLLMALVLDHEQKNSMAAAVVVLGLLLFIAAMVMAAAGWAK